MARRSRRAIVGIEAAIVLIAFVIVAAALAFVALNMGLFTTQKSKETIQRGLGEASTALEVDGSVTGLSDSGSDVSVIAIPIKVSPGREAVDLAKTKTSIKLLLPNNAYENIHAGVLIWNGTDLVNASNINQVVGDGVTSLNITGIARALWSSNYTTTAPQAYVIFIKTVNDDTVMEFGEKAIVVLATPSSEALKPYGKFTLEIRPPQGSPLTVERMIPATLPASGGAVDLG